MATPPVFSAQPNQIAAVVPYEITGQTSTQLRISVKGVNTTAITLPGANTAPGIFTQYASGTGPGQIQNADSSQNGPSNPASVGDMVAILATGEGQTNPPGVDGSADSNPPPAPLAQVSVQIAGRDARVITHGGVTGMPAGYFQVVVQIPSGAPTGDVPIGLTLSSH